jgi:hypothetical protein
MTDEAFTQLLNHLEAKNCGWIHAHPKLRCKVLLDGVEVRYVIAVNRSRGKLKVHRQPLSLDECGKRVRTVTLYGNIKLEQTQ